jgi:hypothetical protein
MATREEQEDGYALHIYLTARAAAAGAEADDEGIIIARFVGADGVGIRNLSLAAAELDWKTLNHVALHVGAGAEGRCLFTLELLTEAGDYDALCTEEQFSDVKVLYTTRLQTIMVGGNTKVRARVCACVRVCVRVCVPNSGRYRPLV